MHRLNENKLKSKSYQMEVNQLNQDLTKTQNLYQLQLSRLITKVRLSPELQWWLASEVLSAFALGAAAPAAYLAATRLSPPSARSVMLVLPHGRRKTFVSHRENFNLCWLPYLVLVKSLSVLFPGGWRTEPRLIVRRYQMGCCQD